MNGSDRRFERFEELDAGRAFGDLDQAETSEWEALAAELGLQGDGSLDRLAADFEIAGAEAGKTALPPALAAKLKSAIPTHAAPSGEGKSRESSIVIGPWLGWAVAACLLALLAIPKLIPGKPADPAGQRAALIEKAPDALRLPLAGAGEPYESAGGEVVWSDSRQEGYLTLANLPANDPARNQYQLWIVDPARDEFPVDGGVFDVPAGEGPVVIPIDAKLLVERPAAFVITLEQPGGVVRSKQEVVVALAKS